LSECVSGVEIVFDFVCARGMGAALLLRAPPVQLAIRLFEVTLQRAALVIGHPVAALLAALAARVAAALAAFSARSSLALLWLSLHVRTAIVPGRGRSRTRSESGCHSNRKERAFHFTTRHASITPVRLVIAIIVPAAPFHVVLLAVNVARQIIETHLQLASLARRQTAVRHEVMFVAFAVAASRVIAMIRDFMMILSLFSLRCD
jgi:hypothetical protein